MKDTYKKAMCIAACVLGVSLVSWTTWRLLPSSADEMRRCAVVVSATSWYEVTVDGKPLLYFAESDADSAVYNVTTDRKKALHRSFSTGVWTNDWLLLPSCKGRLITISHAPSDVLRGCADSTIIRLCREAVTARLRDINKQKSELNYYMRVHNVQDYGYQEVAALDTRVNRAYAEAERVLQLIDSITDGNHGVFVKTHHEYTAIYRSAEGKLVRTPLRLVGSVDGMALLQTADGKTPEGAAAVSLLPWNMDDNCEARAVGFPTIGEEGMECDTVSAQILPTQVEQGRKHRLPRMLGSDGTPVFSTKGRFIGMVCGDTIATRRAIRRILNFEW